MTEKNVDDDKEDHYEFARPCVLGFLVEKTKYRGLAIDQVENVACARHRLWKLNLPPPWVFDNWQISQSWVLARDHSMHMTFLNCCNYLTRGFS